MSDYLLRADSRTVQFDDRLTAATDRSTAEPTALRASREFGRQRDPYRLRSWFARRRSPVPRGAAVRIRQRRSSA